MRKKVASLTCLNADADFQGGLLEMRLTAPSRKLIAGLAFSADGNILLSIDADGALAAWDLRNGPNAQLSDPAPRDDSGSKEILAFCRSQDSDQPKFFSVKLSENPRPVSFRFEPQYGELELTGVGYRISFDDKRRWMTIKSLLKDGPRATLRPHGSMVCACADSSGSDRFATASEFGEIAIWKPSQLSKSSKTEPEPRHANMVTSVDIDGEGKTGVSTGLDGRCLIWDINGGVAVHEIAMGGYGTLGNFAAFLEDSALALIEMPYGKLNLIDARSGNGCAVDAEEQRYKSRWNVRSDFAPASMAKYSRSVLLKACPVIPESGPHRWMRMRLPSTKGLLEKLSAGNPVICRCDAGNVMLPYETTVWESARGDLCREEVCVRYDLTALSGHGVITLVVDAAKRKVHLIDYLSLSDWPVAISLWNHSFQHLGWSRDSLSVAQFECGWDRLSALSLDGARAIVGDFKGNLAFISLAGSSPRVKEVKSAHSASIAACSLRGDGKFAATAGMDNMLALWDCETECPVARIPLPTVPTCCAFSHNGSRIIVGLRGGMILFYAVGGVDPCNIPAKAQLKDAEESIANRLRMKSAAGVERMTSIALLNELRNDAGINPELSKAAKQRAIKIVSNPSWGEVQGADLFKASEAVFEIALGDTDKGLRLSAVEALSDSRLLRQLEKQGQPEVTRAATAKLGMLKDSVSYEVLPTVSQEFDAALELYKICSAGGGAVFVRTKGTFISAQSLMDLYMLGIYPGTIIQIYAEPAAREKCLGVLERAEFLRAVSGDNDALV